MVVCEMTSDRVRGMVGVRYGRLVVQSVFREITMSTPRAMILCDCGNVKNVNVYAVLRGYILSCGCLLKERRGKSSIRHGLSKHPLFRLWNDIKTRCYNQKASGYAIYGGRGIRLSDEWCREFMPFYEWCVSHGWQKGLDIDREDIDGDYSPTNCRFVTRKVNSNNKRNNRWLEYRGQQIKFQELYDQKADKYIESTTVFNRIYRYGWDIDDALTVPTMSRSERPVSSMKARRRYTYKSDQAVGISH